MSSSAPTRRPRSSQCAVAARSPRRPSSNASDASTLSLMGEWTHERYCDALAAEVERFAAATRGEDPATRVPSCPDWSLADLIEHAGRVHRWAGSMVRELMQERLTNVDLGLPDDKAAYPDWLAAGGAELVDRLRAADPEAPMWAWGADQHARF